jgi:anti-sigma28 factor (negative regulator of flagellin synthesis)
VEISGLSGRIAETLEDQAGSRAQRIGTLTVALQAGTYKVDSQALSRALIDQALSAGKP